tara:strand:+ start:1805 stop:3163 length:1359 start_codon:yes stop_codon:yes gene_type:complete
MLAVAILAAGKGTRMKSSLPKVLHTLNEKTILSRVLDTCFELNPDKVFIIVGHKNNVIKKSLNNHKDFKKIKFVLQEPQLGTGHAVQILSKELKNFQGDLLVLNGDVPLIDSKTLKGLIKFHYKKNAEASIITATLENPFGYGRVFLKNNQIEKIVEEKDCNANERKNKVVNSGIYYFDYKSLKKILTKLNNNNSQKEFYITDAIFMLSKSFSYKIINSEEIKGINNRIQLAECEEIIQEKLKRIHMLNGVTFINPSSTTLSEDCEIGNDVVIECNTHIRGKTIIEDNCTIGPNTFIESSFIKVNSTISNSSIFNSKIMENVSIGPYSHIRPESKISKDCKIGNFVETKNSYLSESVKINHLSYVGDCSVGKFTNVGAGTITANFDGVKKHKSIIGENCLIGSNSVLIAPIEIENSVTIGAGSVLNKNVEKNSLAISRVKQVNIQNWKRTNL